MNESTSSRAVDPSLRPALQLAAVFATLKLLFQFALTIYSSHLGYSYFRDEFYYIACGRHLAWGYVDHGPIVALQARLGELLFGESVFAIRILSAAAGAIVVFLTGIITWALGGRRPAQALAMFTLLLTPVFIALDGFLSMNSFEPVFWLPCILALILIQRGHSPALCWTVFGVSAGVGLLNKPSMAFFLVAIGCGLLFTSARRLLFTRWTALAIALLVLIALPNLVWQIHNGWPTYQFLHNGQVEGKNVVLNPGQFLLAQFMQLNPLTALLWVPDIIALLRGRSITHARWLGIAFLIFFVLMYKLHAKDYYLVPFYPALFAAGAAAWEHRFRASPRVARNRLFAFPALEALFALVLLGTLPMAAPVLRPLAWVRFATALHFRPQPTERDKTSLLPQFYADRFGWGEYTRIVNSAFHSLSPADQQHACIYTDNYGEGGALQFFSRRDGLGLPPVISGHNNYWLWGMGGCGDGLLIVITGDTPQQVAETYKSVTVVGRMDNAFSMPYEHKNVYIVRDRRASVPFNWNRRKHFI